MEGLMPKLKLQYFGHLMWRDASIRKDPDARKDRRQEEKGMTKDETVGWHHWLNGHEFEQAPGDSEGQGSLVCCSPWGHKIRTWLSNWTAATGTWTSEKRMTVSGSIRDDFIKMVIISLFFRIGDSYEIQNRRKCKATGRARRSPEAGTNFKFFFTEFSCTT